MNFHFRAAVFLLLLTSCQPGAPVITMLGKVSGFEVSESLITLRSKTSTNPFYVSGKCVGNISEIQVSFDEGNSYSPLINYSIEPAMDCSQSGTFSFKIDPSLSPGSAFTIPANSSYKNFKFRGMSDFGPTTVYNLRMQINTAEDLQITAGSGSTTSGTFTLKGRIISAANSTTSGTLVFKGAIRIK